MPTDFLPLLSYVLISTFTPGPSNVSSASLGVMHGYKNTLNYQMGLAIGVFLIMFLSGWVTTGLLQLFPTLESVLRYVGAVYILYLAYRVLKASYDFTDPKERKPLGLGPGFLLQILNPKLFVYAFTLFSAFLAPLTGRFIPLGIAATLLALVSFIATSVWALFGAVIKTYLQHPRVKMVVNLLLAIFLVYAAIELLTLS